MTTNHHDSCRVSVDFFKDIFNSVVRESGIKTSDKKLHSMLVRVMTWFREATSHYMSQSVSVGCTYLFLPLIPASGTTLHYWIHVLQFDSHDACQMRERRTHGEQRRRRLERVHIRRVQTESRWTGVFLWVSTVHYNDVLIGALASQNTSVSFFFTQPFVQTQIKEKI